MLHNVNREKFPGLEVVRAAAKYHDHVLAERLWPESLEGFPVAFGVGQTSEGSGGFILLAKC